MAQEQTAEGGWQEALQASDREAFQEHVQPHMDALLRAARHDLRYYVAQGDLHPRDLTPEEVTGQTLIHAWDHRERLPAQMSLRGWLLATEYRVLRGLVRSTKQYRQDKVLSLDEPIPPDGADFDTQEWFWEWYQPDAELTWEDVTPAQAPVDIEVPLTESREAMRLEPDPRHALLLHDEFEMALPEIAFALGRSVNSAAELLDQARASLRERLMAAETPADDEPTPLPNDRT